MRARRPALWEGSSSDAVTWEQVPPMIGHSLGLLALVAVASGCSVTTGSCRCLEPSHGLHASQVSLAGHRAAPSERDVAAPLPASEPARPRASSPKSRSRRPARSELEGPVRRPTMVQVTEAPQENPSLSPPRPEPKSKAKRTRPKASGPSPTSAGRSRDRFSLTKAEPRRTATPFTSGASSSIRRAPELHPKPDLPDSER